MFPFLIVLSGYENSPVRMLRSKVPAKQLASSGPNRQIAFLFEEYDRGGGGSAVSQKNVRLRESKWAGKVTRKTNHI
jgi:hypothetical protein